MKKTNYFKLFALSFIVICGGASATNADAITDSIKTVEKDLGARVGVAVLDTQTDKLWSYHGDQRFPLMSTFKTLACANLLSDVEAGKQSFDKATEIKKDELITWSPVTEKHVGKPFTLKQACDAAMIMSDNTAANIVLDGIEGPAGLTAFLRETGDNVSRLDRIEPDLGEAAIGDEKDTTTPNAIVHTLDNLLYGKVLSEPSKKQLKQWMMDNKVSDSLLRSVLPKDWSIADRSGAGGNGSRGVTAAVWSNSQNPLIIGIYLTQTDADFDTRNQAIASIGKAIFSAYGEKK